MAAAGSSITAAGSLGSGGGVLSLGGGLTIGAAPTVNVIVMNNTGSEATLYGWIDYNADGVFDNTTERASVGVPDGTTGEIVALTFPNVPVAFTGTAYARFRLSTDAAAADPTGAASDGEVEDYRVTISEGSNGTVASNAKIASNTGGMGMFNNDDRFGIAATSLGDLNGDGRTNASDFIEVDAHFDPILLAPLEYDFGDAPETGTSLPTTLAAGGARHVITGNTLLLGTTRDAEADGQPTADATGDDAATSGDEDGVDIVSLIRGTTVDITVTSTGAGFVNGWVDFNQDGDWDDPDEQVFIDEAVVSGPNTLQITVPAGATLGSTLARFRLTGSAGYSYFGLAPNGEVEDYQMTVADPVLASTDDVVQESLTARRTSTRPTWWAAISTTAFRDGSINSTNTRSASLFGPPPSLFSTGPRSRFWGR